MGGEDSIERRFKNVYFIRNDSANFMTFSDVIKMPRSEQLENELDIQEWI